MSSLFDTTPAGLTGRFADVAPEQGVDASYTGLTYAVPAAMADLRVGQRVLAPLGKADKPTWGYVVRLHDQPPRARAKTIIERDPHSLSLTGELVELALWMSSYYCCPLGMVFVSMLPAAVKHGTGWRSRTVVGVADPEAAMRPAAPVHDPHLAAASQAIPPERTERTGLSESGSENDASPQPTASSLPRLQARVLKAMHELAQAGRPWVSPRELADAAGARTIGPVKQLVDKGLLAARQVTAVHADPIEEAILQAQPGPPTFTLNTDQQRAIAHLTARLDAGGFGVNLLLGVTGSGKTEVYLRAIEHVLRTDAHNPECGKQHADPSRLAAAPKVRPSEGTRQTGLTESGSDQTPPTTQASEHGAEDRGGIIVLVPEISLTPQAVERYAQRFGAQQLAVLHSGLTAAQRHQQWRRIREGQARIVIGARSAVFAPLPRLGLLIVDEEHENSYKQDSLPRYHARDVAIKRAQLASVTVILGSATPSLESYFNAATVHPAGPADPQSAIRNPKSEIRTIPSATDSPLRPPRYHLLHLPQRVAGLRLPQVEIIDLTQERRRRYQMTGSAGIHLLSLRLETALRQTIDGGGQAMLLLNRRGFANYVSCPDHRCGWLMQCDHCDAAMVYHKDASLPTGGLLSCHHCEAQQILPQQCPACGRRVTVFGLGTQRIEDEIARKFPQMTVARMDRDSMRTSRDYHDTLARFGRGETQVLVGTQMIGKGLDYPNVQLVGVISADTALHLPDFRAAERTFQLVAQVAGRAGRGRSAGRVIVQTFAPHDPAIVLAARHDYETFARREIDLRAQVGLPPLGRLTRIVVRDRDHARCVQTAEQLFANLSALNARLDPAVRLRGPAPCPIARIAGFHRRQIELLAPDAVRMQRLLAAARQARLVKSDARTAVDVDAVVMM